MFLFSQLAQRIHSQSVKSNFVLLLWTEKLEINIVNNSTMWYGIVSIKNN